MQLLLKEKWNCGSCSCGQRAGNCLKVNMNFYIFLTKINVNKIPNNNANELLPPERHCTTSFQQPLRHSYTLCWLAAMACDLHKSGIFATQYEQYLSSHSMSISHRIFCTKAGSASFTFRSEAALLDDVSIMDSI